MFPTDDNDPCGASPKALRILDLYFSVQPVGQNENHDADRSAQEQSTGKGTSSKNWFHDR